MKRTTYLTGIKPTGDLHLGNYYGTIKPILEILQKEENVDLYFFIADCHALTQYQQPFILQQNIDKMMIALMSIFYFDGFDKKNFNESNQIIFYQQSCIAQIFELNWILSNYCAKGLLNRNHSYKAMTENNTKCMLDPDKGIFMGLYTYPVLQAADILIINPDYVPIGPDQKQHIEICNEISRKFNFIHNTDVFTEVKSIVKNNTSFPGKDGRKMSKSYDNTVPLMYRKNELKDFIYKIKTNCKIESDPKYENESVLFDIHKCISTETDHEYFLFLAEKTNCSWKYLKDLVYRKLEKEIGSINNELCIGKNVPYHLEFHLGESIVKRKAEEKLEKIKNIIGL